MSWIVTLGIVGSIASIVGLLLPASGWRARLVHVAYGLAVVALASYAVSFRSRLAAIERAERGARAILDQRQSYGDRAFLQATMAFLEKHRHEFPDSYERANRI